MATNLKLHYHITMKYAFIAGAESGLAKAAIKELENSYFLFCADIQYKEVERENNRINIPMDCCDDESIDKAVSLVFQETDSLALVSSFMGIVTLGSMVELPPSSMERIMMINFLSVYRIYNLLFPLLKNCGGRYVTITSEYGHLDALPIHGYYGVTKHALKMYNDSLRRELQKSGVTVTEVSPGAFRTSMQGGIEKQFDKLIEETHMYKSILTKMRFLMAGELKKAKDPSLFASTYMKAVTAKKPKRCYKVNNSFKMRLLSLLPSSWQDKIYKFYL